MGNGRRKKKREEEKEGEEEKKGRRRRKGRRKGAQKDVVTRFLITATCLKAHNVPTTITVWSLLVEGAMSHCTLRLYFVLEAGYSTMDKLVAFTSAGGLLTL